MIDGSRTNSIFDLILGYNGLGRIFGASGPGGGGGGGGNFSGSTGVLRLFNDLMGGQASWLLPAALLALVLGLWTTRRAPRTDRTRAALLLWGGWLVVSAAVFSLGSGVIHTYYTVALAPAIAVLTAIGAVALWRARASSAGRLWLAAGLGFTAVWGYVLLARTPTFVPWLRWLVLIGGVGAALTLVSAPALGRVARRATVVAAAVATIACIGGPLAYSAQTISTGHTGSVPSAGPSTGTGGGFGAGRSGAPGGSGAGAPGEIAGTSTALVTALQSGAARYRWVAAVSGSEQAASLELASGGLPVMGIGGFNNQAETLSLARFEQYVKAGQIHYYVVGQNGPGGGGLPGGGGPGGPPAGATARGGFPGGSPPSGASHGAANGGGPGGSSTTAITSWVKAHFKAVTIGGQTVYDLTQAT